MLPVDTRIFSVLSFWTFCSKDSALGAPERHTWVVCGTPYFPEGEGRTWGLGKTQEAHGRLSPHLTDGKTEALSG